MYTSTTQVRVRYGETDQMGYLYYGNYGLYYEVARTEAIRELGLSYKQLEELGIFMPVIDFHAQYLRPAYYDDLITIKTTIKELTGGHTIQFHSEFFNEKGKLLNKGVVTLVFYDPVQKKKVNMHPTLYATLLPYFQPSAHHEQ